MSQTLEKTSDWQLYKRLLSYLKPFLFVFALSSIGFLAYAASQPLFAHVFGMVVDAINDKDPDAAYIYPFLFVAVFLARGIASFIAEYFMAVVSTGIVYKLRLEIFERLLRLPAAYYDANASGHLVSRITYTVEQVKGAITGSLKVFIREGLTIVGLISYLLWQDWKLTLVFLVSAPFIAMVVSFTNKKFRKISKRIQTAMGDVTHVSSEAINGYKEVRTFGAVDYENKRFFDAITKNRKQSLKMELVKGLATPTIQILVAIALGILTFLVLKLSGDEQTAGGFVAYIGSAAMMPKPIRQLSEAFSVIQRGLAAGQDIFDTLDEQEEKDEGSKSVEKTKGDLQFKAVNFKYRPELDNVLKNINLDIKAGQTIAFVGPSGSGKSTLASLIPRFYDYTEGDILLDGTPINEYRLADLRQQISLVTQQVTLFNDTVGNNIAYGGLSGATKEQIKAAAIKAHAWGFIAQLSEGLDTMVGDDGVLLSGGQRQRIAIARSLLKDAPILILDEATSALDTESERHIQAALEEAMIGRTTLVIAHRLSTIENADLIVVVKDGAIVEQGDHRSLLALNKHYSKLHQKQFQDE